MILENMTIPEIRNQIEKDQAFLIVTINNRVNYLNRKKSAQKIKRIRDHQFHTSPTTQNRWFIGFELTKKHSNVTIGTIYQGTNEFKLCVLPSGNGLISIYRGHFFYRYAQRTGVNYKNIEELIAKFFKSNMIHSRNIEEKTCTYIFPEGFALGRNDEENWVDYIDTFLTEEMLFENQITVYKDDIEGLRRYAESKYPPEHSIWKNNTFSSKKRAS
jgi:hypothetical protein